MDQSNRSVCDLYSMMKSWIPSRPEPANVSRDFWMPDHSCSMCYECDARFTLFNRRHHCRLCGRIFCGKCTAHFIPAPYSDLNHVKEDWDKIRVCNFCFKQWEKGIATSSDYVANDAAYDPRGSPPGGSSSSSRTNECSPGTLGITSLPLGSGERMSQECSPSAYNQSAVMDPYQPADMESPMVDPFQSPMSDLYNDGQGEEGSGSSNNSGAANRFEYEDDGFSQTWTGQFFGQDEVEEFQDTCGSSHSLQPDGEIFDRNDCSSSVVQISHESHDSLHAEDVKEETDHDMGYAAYAHEASSSICVAEDVEMEPVDFENNGFIWLPPEPENDEDEKDTALFDDDDEYVDEEDELEEEDDEVNDPRELGCLRTMDSNGSGDYCGKDKFIEDHRKAMNKVVDGHFRALVSQLLQVENIPVDEDDDSENWLEIITSLCWEAATILKPDTSKNGRMDPGVYVKVKCLASGHRSESTVMKGVVCRKNVAHRRMTTRIEKPCLMVLGGGLEYQRVSNLLSSVDTLLKQEMDHLKMAVAKIDAQHPNVLLVEKSVSRFAQDCILEKDISLVLNVKRPLLERIARCTGAQIVPSIDHLSSQNVENIGYCESFHVDRLVEEHGSAGQGGRKLSKTLMYFEGCPRPLGCTILLRGANGDELKKVKGVIQYGFFAAYHLALETSFLVDEGAFLPEPPPKDDPITVALPENICANLLNGDLAPTTDSSSRVSSLQSTELEKVASLPIDSEPVSAFSQASSVSSKPLKDVQPVDESSQNIAPRNSCKEMSSTYRGESGAIDTNSNLHAAGEVVIKVPSSLEQDTKKDQNALGSPKELFPPLPSDNQSILVSLSSRCVVNGTECERSHLCRIKYYGSFDKPLGRVLQDKLFDQNYRCNSCEMPSDAHAQCYTHRQGTLLISVKKLPEILLPGEHDGKIWMWHRCLKCPRTGGIPPATRRVLMSDAAWGLSFGKFLELSFSNHAAASRVASCGHSLHRDCLRFYGSGIMVACFRYASIDVHSIFLPPFIVNFNYEIQDWIKKEAAEVAERAHVLFSVILRSLAQITENRSSGRSIKGDSKVPESRPHIAELKEVLRKEKAEFEEILQATLTREAKKGEPVVDILEINRLRRQLLFQSYMWDHRLVYASVVEKESISRNTNHPFEPEENKLEAREVSDTSKVLNCVESFSVKSKSGGTTPKKVQGRNRGHHVSGGQVNNIDEPNYNSDSGTPIRRAVSDNHFSFVANFTDTLDEAWSGKNRTGADSRLVAGAGRLALERQLSENLAIAGGVSRSPRFSKISNNGDNVEDSVSWIRMPFVNFYRALNRNFLGFNQKLDTLGVYNPGCVSAFQELEQQSGARLSLPVGTNEIVIPIFDDEPTSLISYALASLDYQTQICDEGSRLKEMLESTVSLPLRDLVMFNSFKFGENSTFRSYGSLDETSLSMPGSQSPLIPDSLSVSKSLHVRVSFSDNGPTDQVKYTITCYCAKQFDSLRKICCPSELDFIRSLSRCKKWGAQGGKSNVFFAKTLDDRFIIKQVTKTELESFIKFASEYFKYLTESISTNSPTCLAKILGIYQVTTKHLKGGKETKMDVLVMENLLFGRKFTRLYDLKGSTRSRYNADPSGSNKVLLDQNLIEAMPTSPIFVGNKAKRLLGRAVWNDTSFLTSVDVMDYSLIVGVDEEKHELVLGIIDFMRQYTWDKHLETWVKASGILGGSKNSSPTVISPKQYKKRFRKAMAAYFLMVPDEWYRDNPQGGNPAD